ncbi:peptide chain release factor N(5)-glutamine methyltransferase [Cetobacterium sp. 2A]|uniref:peptide chain release factor N(5)-glutamine methyltransferase n=1 Tax=Cetobacterium sp. 2A TaxID=2754723 RepID=UPI00163CA0F1|nr:peptide chain release factor N(5)-glutamine methyltransferase [Cetobacterium sp. 2A]MBC2855943.1 peptide chain release factor N(5)-glutamine methyltransferase [Cetobacterium sp. 2A]
MKLLDILNFSEEYLKKYSFSKSRLESQKIVAHVLKLDRISLYVYSDMELSLDQKEKVKNFLKEMARKRLSFDEILKTVTPEEKDTISYQDENRELLNKSIEYLKTNGVNDARLDAEYIFAHILGVTRGTLTLNFHKKISEEDRIKIKDTLIQRAKNKRPLQYLIGEWEFYGYPFKVDERVLIPRPDTEILVEQCKFLLQDMENPKVLDIGTGSGAIAITLAKEVPTSSVLGLDISSDALEVAKINRELNNVSNLKLQKSDIFSSVKDKDYSLIVSNPPYIPQTEYETLQPEVRIHEPAGALTDKGDGYYFYKTISKEAKNYLKVGGYLAFEVGYNQADKVQGFMEENGFVIVARVCDYGGIERVVIGRKNGE